MSSITISDLNQDSILADLSDEQISIIQGGLGILAGLAIAGGIILCVGILVGLSGHSCDCN